MAGGEIEKGVDVGDAAARVQASFARVGFLAHIGAVLRRVEAGRVEIELPLRDEVRQQQGYGHGGAVATILDAACGYAALTVMPPGSEVLSVEFKVNLLAPAVGVRLVARGRVVKAGRMLVVTTGECASVGEDGAEKVVGVMQGTMMRVGAEKGE